MKACIKIVLFLLYGGALAESIDRDPFSQLKFSDQVNKDDQKKTKQEMDATVTNTTTGQGVEGIDTLSIEEGGNWLLKRKALEDTVDVIESIGRVFGEILAIAGNFRVERNKFDNEYNAFVNSIGFDLGTIDSFLANLIDSIESQRKKEGDLNQEERELENQIEEKRSELKNLQSSTTKIRALNAQLADVLVTVDQQVEIGNEYQNQAWKNFQTIKKILNDEKAEELYYRSEGLLKNIKAILNYLKQTLFSYFNEQADILRNEMQNFEKTVDNLKQKGVSLKQEVDREEKAAEEKSKSELEKERNEQLKKEAEVKQNEIREQEKNRGFFMRIFDYLASFFK